MTVPPGAAPVPPGLVDSAAAARPRAAGGGIPHVLPAAALTAAVIAAALLFLAGGATYYGTPLRVRGYHEAHRMLRPSGTIGHLLGITGSLLMVVMHLYSVRKRNPRWLRFGAVPAWLEFHIFCGILGPVLVTFHTSFRFNGIVSVAYWSMVLVMLSGFVGRYLYVRIPRTIRGQELTLEEIEAQASALKQQLLDTTLPADLLAEVERFEERACRPPRGRVTVVGLVAGDLLLRSRERRLRRAIRASGVRPDLLEGAVGLVHERAVLLRRIAYLRQTRKLFELWHVFHRPLAAVMLAIVIVHVATAIYLGYGFFGRS